MDIIIKIFDTVGRIMNMCMDIFGYSVSFMNILAFIIIVSVCALFIAKLID